MEPDTGASAADVVAALRSIGITVTPDEVAGKWPVFRELAHLFNAAITDGG